MYPLPSPLPQPISSRTVFVSATPALGTAAYTANDALGTAVVEFANVVRTTGGSAYIDSMIVLDKAAQSAAGELWLFNATVTSAAAGDAHSISDADAAKCVGVIPFGPYYASALNSVSIAKGINLPFTVAATSLFGILVTRGTPTYAADSLTVILGIAQN